MKKHLLPALALTAVVFSLNLPSLRYGYLLEDYYYLRSYTLEEIATVFHSHWEPSMLETKGYRPFHAVHYAFFHWLIGGDPTANHLLNLILHLCGVFLLYALVQRCRPRSSAAFWTALIYSCLGTTSWQVSQLTNRQHLLLVIFLLASLIAYHRYLLKQAGLSWLAALAFFICALLLKEVAVVFPLIISAFALIVGQKTLRGQFKPLLPFFLLLVVFLTVRYAVLQPLPNTFIHPPPPPHTPGRALADYSHGLLASLLQSHGMRDPGSPEFPVYARGVRDTRSVVALCSLAGLLIFSLPLLFRRGSTAGRRIFFFGLALLLIANVMVAAWYRTNRLFITSLGVAIMDGTAMAAAFQALSRPSGKKAFLGASAAVLFFAVYLGANLHTYLEIQWGLRPDGHIAKVWDRWLIEEDLLPWIPEEQMNIFESQLRRTGKLGWTESLPRRGMTGPKDEPEALPE